MIITILDLLLHVVVRIYMLANKIRGFQTRVVYLDYKTCLRCSVLVQNLRNVAVIMGRQCCINTGGAGHPEGRFWQLAEGALY